MKFKLDENFGKRIKELFVEQGYDTETVFDEKLQGSDDKILFDICVEEKRCLVTLDLDFSDVVNFPPEDTGGIVVIRAAAQLSFQLINLLVKQFLKAVQSEDLTGKLWIVEPNRIRIHQRND